MIKTDRTNNLSPSQQNIYFKKLAADLKANKANQPEAVKTCEMDVSLDSKIYDSINKAHDEILPTDIKTKTRVNITQALSLPEYAVRGLKGDPDANFFEFLQLAKIPYYVGGPILALCFAAGGDAAKAITRQKAVGVGLFYLAAMLASKAINVPVKMFTGVDLDQSYKKIVRLRTKSPDGLSPMRKEYHKVFESTDFTYFDLLRHGEDKAAHNHRIINKNFNDIAKKMGINHNLNDSDSTVKPNVKKLIIMSRAWKYALTIPYAALAIGLSMQDSWKNLGNQLKNDFVRNALTSKQGMSPLENTWFRIKGAGLTLKGQFWNTLKNSVKDFWNGTGAKGITKYYGKAAVISAITATLLANWSILRAGSLKDKKSVDVSKFPDAIQEKRKNLMKNAFDIVGKSRA
ncbi:MAG: hypothetical protein A2287_08490 [Candidatus Melainabacteria bacterium RIFOXYA12_FULL_32_12]|nr:MAG: hypothetical protein A2255_07415 [Candidatus Melainabacteria bacterium RIFOXYA2_FULL_32_9]OGI28037.1 MAG: hypothetical protein A2287_08490 [Candidatus Melainabacteria bacterium RIFOXYA12_FULL_32_12]